MTTNIVMPMTPQAMLRPSLDKEVEYLKKGVEQFGIGRGGASQYPTVYAYVELLTFVP